MMDADALRRNVLEELAWDASVDASNIVVATNADGVVTLMGQVPTYAGKVAAEKAVKRLRGVKGVANELNVQLLAPSQRDDSTLAHAAVNALASTRALAGDEVKVTVDHGLVTLDGEVKSHYQKKAAEDVVRPLMGVTGLVSRITVAPDVEPIDIGRMIGAAFARNARIDAGKVRVDARDGRVMLHGTVGSWAEREEAAEVAWSAPGVKEVIDLLGVDALTPVSR